MNRGGEPVARGPQLHLSRIVTQIAHGDMQPVRRFAEIGVGGQNKPEDRLANNFRMGEFQYFLIGTIRQGIPTRNCQRHYGQKGKAVEFHGDLNGCGC